jgi:hypothetical protein
MGCWRSRPRISAGRSRLTRNAAAMPLGCFEDTHRPGEKRGRLGRPRVLHITDTPQSTRLSSVSQVWAVSSPEQSSSLKMHAQRRRG